MTAIKITDLTKKFRDKTAVDQINLEINEGELFGLLGVNGAGKTTTIRMLSGLSNITGGDAAIFGHSIKTELSEVKKIINISPQETAVASNLTVKENLELIACIYGMSKSDTVKRSNDIISVFALDEVINQRAKTLSAGWQRRLSIAMALITEPKVIFLDEPTLGLDVLARRELWSFIKSLKGKITIVLTTHYLEEIEALSDRVAVMVKGKIKANGSVDELKRLTGKDNLEDAFVEIAQGGAEK